MTYSLHTLQNPAPIRGDAPAPTGFGRFGNEILLIFGFVALVLWVVALLSYSSTDAAWSTSGTGMLVANRVGRFGAWVADMSYFLLGFSVWWCVVVAVRTWLSLLANRLRGESPWLSARQRFAFWTGLVLLMLASTSLEWTRLYSLELRLPGHSGGALGYWIGPMAMKWLGFAGSGLVAIAMGVIGSALVFGFSWMHVAESLGGWLDGLVESQRERRELAQDLELGQRAMRERARDDVDFDDIAEPARVPGAPVPGFNAIDAPDGIDAMDAPAPAARASRSKPVVAPVVIEPVLVDLPPSERVAKERQKPLFIEMPDSKLPQVALLDVAQLRQETVAPETLEMTSRMIEKKLKDFGVEVRVVLAQPGPVITRYEIEPATGVKGSQIVGLAKDLARSLSLVSIRVVETIPGKNYMALELPNAKRQSIKLSEILGSQVYNDSKSMLTMGLGKDIVGNPIVADLAKMPHVLVAGTTGSGK